MRKALLLSALLLGAANLATLMPASAQEQGASDVGTLTKQAADKLFPTKRPYSPYAGRNFPTRPFFGDTHLHTSFSMDAGAFGARLGPARRLPLRQGRGGHGLVGPAGQALAPARLPRRRRPLRQHGLLPRPVRRQARACSPIRRAGAGTT